jgi:ABC-type arginine transport system permease subunit
LWSLHELKTLLLPRTEDDLYVAVAILMAGYIVIGLIVDAFSTSNANDAGKKIIERTFNAATFAASLLLFIGILFPDVLRAIGNVKPYLLFASLAGMYFSLRALFPW